ncbi:MAG: RNA polymerase sigma factor [Planctomycetota bacterium]|nr:RNA polymerase sigma factor [Planctomycetota bacterium]
MAVTASRPSSHLAKIVPLEPHRGSSPARSGPCHECRDRVHARQDRAELTLLPRVERALPALDRTLVVAERILGSWDLAWDAVQEALVRLWQEPETPPDAEGWLYQAVVHRALHARRTRQRRARYEEVAGARRVGVAEDPRLRLEVEDQARRVEVAIDQLPGEFREALRLRELEGLDYHAIARTLDVPVGTVRSRIHRGRERLQAELGLMEHSA